MTHSVKGEAWNNSLQFRTLSDAISAHQSSVHPRLPSPHFLAHPDVGLFAALHYADDDTLEANRNSDGYFEKDNSPAHTSISPRSKSADVLQQNMEITSASLCNESMQPEGASNIFETGTCDRTSPFQPPPGPPNLENALKTPVEISKASSLEGKDSNLDIFQAELRSLMRRSLDAEAEARANFLLVKNMESKLEQQRIELNALHRLELEKVKTNFQDLVEQSGSEARSNAKIDWQEEQLELEGRANHAERELAHRLRDNARIVGAMRSEYVEEIEILKEELRVECDKNYVLVERFDEKTAELNEIKIQLENQQRYQDEALKERFSSLAADMAEQTRSREEVFEKKMLHDKEIEINKMRQSFMALVLESQDRSTANNAENLAKVTLQTSLAGLEELRRIEQTCDERIHSVEADADRRVATMEDEIHSLRSKLERRLESKPGITLEGLEEEVRRGEERERALTETLTQQTKELKRKQDTIDSLRKELKRNPQYNDMYLAESTEDIVAISPTNIVHPYPGERAHSGNRSISESGTSTSEQIMLPLSADRYSKTRASELPVSGRLRRVTEKTTTSVPALVDKEGLLQAYPSNDAQQFNPRGTSGDPPRWKPAAPWTFN